MPYRPYGSAWVAKATFFTALGVTLLLTLGLV